MSDISRHVLPCSSSIKIIEVLSLEAKHDFFELQGTNMLDKKITIIPWILYVQTAVGVDMC